MLYKVLVYNVSRVSSYQHIKTTDWLSFTRKKVFFLHQNLKDSILIMVYTYERVVMSLIHRLCTYPFKISLRAHK